MERTGKHDIIFTRFIYNHTTTMYINSIDCVFNVMVVQSSTVHLIWRQHKEGTPSARGRSCSSPPGKPSVRLTSRIGVTRIVITKYILFRFRIRHCSYNLTPQECTIDFEPAMRGALKEVWNQLSDDDMYRDVSFISANAR